MTHQINCSKTPGSDFIFPQYLRRANMWNFTSTVQHFISFLFNFFFIITKSGVLHFSSQTNRAVCSTKVCVTFKRRIFPKSVFFSIIQVDIGPASLGMTTFISPITGYRKKLNFVKDKKNNEPLRHQARTAVQWPCLFLTFAHTIRTCSYWSPHRLLAIFVYFRVAFIW